MINGTPVQIGITQTTGTSKYQLFVRLIQQPDGGGIHIHDFGQFAGDQFKNVIRFFSGGDFLGNVDK